MVWENDKNGTRGGAPFRDAKAGRENTPPGEGTESENTKKGKNQKWGRFNGVMFHLDG